MLRKLAFGLISAVLLIACTPLAAKPRPSEITLSALDLGSPDSLAVVAEWQPVTVGVMNGPITYPVRWLKNALQIKNDTVPGTKDTVRFARALVGRSDTIQFFVSSLYTVNGRKSNETTVVRIFANADLQIPSVPVLIRVDTLP